jgi:glutathione S-transferase
MSTPWVYHGADVSYFSGKARPALSQKGLHWSEVRPRMDEIRKHTGLSFIPVLVTPEGEYWQDTSEILDRLEQRQPDPPLFPATPVQRAVAYLIELYGDEVGILPAMHYRWSFPESVAKVRADFAASSGDLERSGRFADRMAGALPMLGITPETIPVIEAHTRELLEALCAHFEAHAFLLGDRMSLADCGLMGPLYGHLYRDAAPGRLLRETAVRVCAWIERMGRPDPERQTGWLDDDALAPTLVEVLRVMADGVPMLVDTARAINAWADENARPGETPARAVGLHETTYRNVPVHVATRPYSLWMIQRPLDAYRALTASERARVDIALAGTGWEPLLALAPGHRLGKHGNDLVWEDGGEDRGRVDR